VCRIDQPDNCREIKNVVVDTDTMVSAIPESVIKLLGIIMPQERVFILAGGERVRKPVGTAMLKVGDRFSSDDIISIPDGAIPRLGIRALEGMGYQVDPTTKELKKGPDVALLL
jgi:predicted aspartyl protease